MFLILLLLGILTEASVELFFTAGPMIRIRAFLIRKTPFLDIEDYGNVFDCKYCMSLWIGLFIVLTSTYINYPITRLIAFGIIVARTSNFMHIIAGALRDVQINMRLKR